MTTWTKGIPEAICCAHCGLTFDAHIAGCNKCPQEVAHERIRRLQAWVNDCQAGMYINCVYCGHRYGPDDEVPATMADVLKEHIEQCPEHPLSAARVKIRRMEKALRRIADGAHSLARDPADTPAHIARRALGIEIE